MGEPRTLNLSTIGFSAAAARLIEIASARSASFFVAVWNTPHMVLVCWFCSCQKKMNKYLLFLAAVSIALVPGLAAVVPALVVGESARPVCAVRQRPSAASRDKAIAECFLFNIVYVLSWRLEKQRPHLRLLFRLAAGGVPRSGMPYMRKRIYTKYAAKCI